MTARTVAVVQARVGSRRLPGKVLEAIKGRPLLWYVVQRAQLATRVDRVVVATPDTEEDLAIHAECAAWGIDCYAGVCAEHDVLTRFTNVVAMIEEIPDYIVRITADCPLIDPSVIDRTIAQLQQNAWAQFATNVADRTFPDGLDVEAMTFNGLIELYRRTKEGREHVTPLLYDQGACLTVTSVRNREALGHLRWTVDTPEDLAFVREVYRQMAPRWDFSWQEVLRLGAWAHRKAA
jgi:spore coat polysaccharide biosynthesis protein SpsF (cytidylyltransferase family)